MATFYYIKQQHVQKYEQLKKYRMKQRKVRERDNY